MITSSHLFLHNFVVVAHLFLKNETSDITTTEQMTIYATFNYQRTIKEHYVGIMPVKAS